MFVFFVGLVLLVFSSCSSFFVGKQPYISHFEKKQFTEALKDLEPRLKKQNKDFFLYLLEEGVIYFEKKDYRKAIETFTLAEKMASRLDYKDFTEDTLAMFTTDKNKIFRPFDYERIMINVYLAISYLSLEKYDDAVVESRRINNLVRVLKSKGLKNFQELALAWYISAFAYEQLGKEDDAKIDYKRAKKKLKIPFNFMEGKKLLIVETAFVPIKAIDYDSEIPVLKYRGYCANLQVNGKKAYLIENFVSIASQNFKERLAWLRAKSLLKIALQGALAYGVAKLTKSETAGIASFLLLRAFNSPDIRSWQTLPGCFYIYRYDGESDLNIKYMTSFKVKHLTIKANSSKVLMLRIF